MIQVMHNPRSRTGRELSRVLSNSQLDGTVNWSGRPVTWFEEGMKVLNPHSRSNKLQQLIDLHAGEVPTVDFANQALGPDWLPRRIFHQQGFDFTNPRLRRGLGADFYVKRENLTDEYRVHVFRTKRDNMRVLRVGKKVPARDIHHPWVRTHRLGWRISYVGGLTEDGLGISRMALRVLHLDFGAVDLGIREDGSPIVLEVNTCPGMDIGNTMQRYISNIEERFS